MSETAPLTKAAALQALTQHARTRVLGIERFVQRGSGYQPDLTGIADYSASEDVATSIKAATAFIGQSQDDALFSIVFDD